MSFPKSKPLNRHFENFSEKYSFYIPESHKRFLSDTDLNLFLKARYNFIRERKEELKIDIYNPNSEFLWLSNSSVIEIMLPDSPFIVDTIVGLCNAEGYKIELIIHPIFSVERKANGQIKTIDYLEAGGQHESYVYLEINKLTPKQLKSLKSKITQNLSDLRSVVTDYPDMITAIEQLEIKSRGSEEELNWLKENFVLLGLSKLTDHRLTGAAFGVLKRAEIRKAIAKELGNMTHGRARTSIKYLQTGVRSNVNKSRPMYLVKLRSEGGALVMAGHFRYRADIDLRNNVPPIRRMLDSMADDMRVSKTSYLRKELYKTAQALPVGLLLTHSKEFLLKWFMKIISNMYATEIICDITTDKSYRLVWAQVILPRHTAGHLPQRALADFLQQHDIEQLHAIRHILNEVEVFFLGFHSDKHSIKNLQRLIENHAEDLFSTWLSRFQELVTQRYAGDAAIKDILARFLKGMSPDYEIHQEPVEVLADLETLEKLTSADGYKVSYYHSQGRNEDLLKIYSCSPANLSDLVPIFSNFGFTINRNYTFPYKVSDARKFTYMFEVGQGPEFSDADKKRIAEAVRAVLNGELTARPINELVLVAGLTVRELNLVRAICAYFYKIDTSFAFSSIQRVLVNYPDFVTCLIQLFYAKFKPSANAKEETTLSGKIDACFRDLRSVEDEKICKAFLAIVNAIVRTNYFLNRDEISFKIRSSLIENMPAPVPRFEIYIYSHGMEGIHLRGGAVARGGIRWSDRQDDLRTEILGLMKAQMVKNTVIVPVGSKGGFVVKNQLPGDRQAWLATGAETYKRFISCLLELTDNLRPDGKVVAAKNIKRLDDDDPYLVVAADKGTATFSDMANQISLEMGFWLTDAFASGGSNGYDHKKQGITARGTWASVKRHFHEIGINPEKNAIKAVGIGDMGGDVFGNGLLLSGTIKLLAAFNHLYIFLDPNPEPHVSFQERQRLFDHALNWDEYDAKLISKGGGIFPRSSRRIALSAQVRQELGIRATFLSGEELIKAILRAPVDLLWNGGIGTYVKADHETHFQAGDPANDRVRINASELRSKVLGEGGNLGLTQAARIQAAHRGVRLNTDAIDNSAGVNMSDHEVNLKILLDSLLRKKQLKGLYERNQIIRKLETEEVKLVLQQNYHNNLGLSLDMLRIPTQFIFIRALIKFLNRRGVIHRAQDRIPYEADLDSLEQNGETLARPILCSLVGFAKLYGTQLFLESDAFDDPWYDRFILRYFPAKLSKKYELHIKEHPLKREIIITEAINEIVNHAGIVFFQRMHMETGLALADIADVYLRLSEFLQLNKLRSDVEIVDEWLPSAIHYEYLILLEEKVYQIVKRLLKNRRLMQVLAEEDLARFSQMLREASRHASYRLSRKSRITLRILSLEVSLRIADAFKRVNILEDAFNIFMNNKLEKAQWQISEYFSILQQYKINELRRILATSAAKSRWELRFFSKIENQIVTLITRIVRLRDSNSQEIKELKQRIKSILKDIVRRDSTGVLTPSVFFEMLEFINSSLENK